MRRVAKEISGGQTGVDQAALLAARDCELEIGGWCPPGRVCEDGVIPAEFPLRETPQERSPNAPDVPRSQRTEWNVRDSEGTLVIVPGDGNRSGCPTTFGSGTKWTIECAGRYERPLVVSGVNDPKAKEEIQQWLNESQIKTLNVAGPSEATSQGIGDHTYALLRRVFDL